MLSEIAFVCCALIALQASFGLSLPTGHTVEDLHIDPSPPYLDDFHQKEKDEEDGYQVIPLGTEHSLKVEVVDEDGTATIRTLDVVSAEKPHEKVQFHVVNQQKKSRKNRDESRDEKGTSKCNWRKLYKLYLNKRRINGEGKVNLKTKKDIREAFKVVCENPEDVIRYLLDIQ